jgi:hypothetical protein
MRKTIVVCDKKGCGLETPLVDLSPHIQYTDAWGTPTMLDFCPTHLDEYRENYGIRNEMDVLK